MTVQRNILGARVAALPTHGEGEGSRDNAFDLTGIFQLFMVRQRIIVGTAAAIIAISAIVVFRMTPLYDATAQVILDERENKVVDVNAVLSGLPNDPTSIENQLNILRSRNLMSRVVDKLHLDTSAPLAAAAPSFLSTIRHYVNPLNWFRPPPQALTKEELEQKRRDGLIDGLLAGESVAEIGESSAMTIKFRSSDPENSATVANAIADAYVEDQLNAKFEATQKAAQWLGDRLQQLSGQMQSADAAVQEYKAENNIEETPTGSVVDQQLAELNGQLVMARSDLAAAEAKYARVRQLQSAGRAEDVAQVFQSGMIEQLRQQQSDLMRQQAELATTFGPRHPKMLDIESQIRNIDAKIGEEVKRVVETVANDVAVASAHVQSLEGSLSQIESQSTVQNKAKVKLTELMARSASAHQLYEAFLGKFKETQGQEGIQSPDARIISRAVVPEAPVVPNKTRSMEFAVVGGIVLGFLFAFLVERLDSGFRTVPQIEQMLGVPVLTTLSEVPETTEKSSSAADLVVDRPMSSFAESMRGLNMGLVLSNVDRKPKVILITSSVPDEGKTTVALSLARTISRTGQRVVLVDGDFRRPSLARALNMPTDQVGLIETLLGKASLEKCLVKDPHSDVVFLPTSRVAANPPDLAGSVAMEKVVATLKGVFDTVVIDSAPILPVNDTKILARLADTMVFVVRWEKTPRIAVATAARVLADINAHVAGVVLARADQHRYRFYNYGYQNYYRYGKYYNE